MASRLEKPYLSVRIYGGIHRHEISKQEKREVGFASKPVDSARRAA
jgi:hypothetical protein